MGAVLRAIVAAVLLAVTPGVDIPYPPGSKPAGVIVTDPPEAFGLPPSPPAAAVPAQPRYTG